MMDVMLVVDMQVGLLNRDPKHELGAIIRHHNWVWSRLITQRSIRLARTDELLR
jgi:hypothetical protein